MHSPIALNVQYSKSLQSPLIQASSRDAFDILSIFRLMVVTSLCRHRISHSRDAPAGYSERVATILWWYFEPPKPPILALRKSLLPPITLLYCTLANPWYSNSPLATAPRQNSRSCLYGLKISSALPYLILRLSICAIAAERIEIWEPIEGLFAVLQAEHGWRALQCWIDDKKDLVDG